MIMKKRQSKNVKDLKDHFKKRFWQRLKYSISNEEIAVLNRLVRTGKWISASRQSITRLIVLLQTDEIGYKEKFIAIYNKNLKTVVTCFPYVLGQPIRYNDCEWVLEDEKGEKKDENKTE